MPEMHLKHPGFTYSACGLFSKNKDRIPKFKEEKDAKYIFKNKLGKACFQHDMAQGDFKYLAKRTSTDKVLTLIRLGFLRVVFSGVVHLTPFQISRRINLISI